jgi:hypothetical protein
MKLPRGFANFALVGLLILSLAWLAGLGSASEEQDLEFQVIGSGDISGHREENYLVIRTKADWEELWVRHVILVSPCPPAPEVDFSSDMMICAFMGQRRTGGYSISIERICTVEEEVHVEVVKCSPPLGVPVIQVVTFPYVFALMEKTAMDFTFEVTNEDGKSVEYLTPRPPDVTDDDYCGIDDVVEVAIRFGSTADRHDWHSKYDLNRDFFVGIDDIIEIICHFGKAV